MFRFSRLSRRATLAVVLGVTTVSAAGAATFHRLATTGTTGSEGAVATLQTSATGSAIQGEVAASTNTAVKYPFGVLGEYDAAGSTFGIGLIGLSTTGYAIGGESLSSNQPSIIAYPGGNGMGLEALTQSTSSSPAIYAQSNGQGDGIDGAANNQHAAAGVLGEDLNNPGTFVDGVLGTTISGGYGVEGTSSDNALGGVHGLATTGVGVEGDSSGGSGVFGSNSDPGSNGNPAGFGDDVGVYASSIIGSGVYATSTNGNGLYAVSSSATGVEGISNGSGFGVFGSSYNGEGGSFQNLSAESPTLALYKANNASSGTLIEADDQYCEDSATPCLTLDSGGNLLITGTLTQSYSSFSRTRNPTSDVMSYSQQSTEPTIEDVGRAKLIGGSATVAISADFRTTIDSSDYMVFLTPHGDSNGLYIASESASGFIVRESHGGRSTLAFDYRIVAQQYGAHEGRLPHYATLHPNERKQHSAAIARRHREHMSEQFGAQPRLAIVSKKQQQALNRALNRRRFVPPPVTFMPQPASFSVR